MRRAYALPIALVTLSLAHAVLADEIAVSPGKDTIAAALTKAKAGDTVKLAAGEYTESFSLPGDVTLKGAGADKTVITGVKGATINCQGPHNTVSDLTVKGSKDAFRGVNTSTPVRIERCRFVNVPEAVAMMGAPLSDVVACEFVDCGIGVRAIGNACPTVWGCSFKGGNMGVFAMDGSPYIRNNLFQGNKVGVRMLPHEIQPAIIRNNDFVDCTDSAVTVLEPRNGFGGPSIRNNIVANCGAAAEVPAKFAGDTTSNLYKVTKAPAFKDAKGTEVPTTGNTEGDAGVAVSATLAVTLAHPELVEGKGVRLSSEAPGTKGTIGLEKAWMQVGVGATAPLPPVRFGGAMLIANSVGEEYQYLQVMGRGMGGQSMGKENGVTVDRQTPGDGQKPAEFVFDISRFFSESGMKP